MYGRLCRIFAICELVNWLLTIYGVDWSTQIVDKASNEYKIRRFTQINRFCTMLFAIFSISDSIFTKILMPLANGKSRRANFCPGKLILKLLTWTEIHLPGFPITKNQLGQLKGCYLLLTRHLTRLLFTTN